MRALADARISSGSEWYWACRMPEADLAAAGLEVQVDLEVGLELAPGVPLLVVQLLGPAGEAAPVALDDGDAQARSWR